MPELAKQREGQFRKERDENEVTHLVRMDEPVDRSGLECPVTVRDNDIIDNVEMVRDTGLLRLHATV